MPYPRIPTALIAPAFNPATFADPGAVDALFTRLRKDYPLAVAEVPGFDPHWIITRWSDLREVTRQDNIFHSERRQGYWRNRDLAGNAGSSWETLERRGIDRIDVAASGSLEFAAVRLT